MVIGKAVEEDDQEPIILKGGMKLLMNSGV